MRVVLAAPPGDQWSIVYVDWQYLMIPGLHGWVAHVYRLALDDADGYQRRTLAARKADKLGTWLAFARWYGRLRKRVVVAALDERRRQARHDVLRLFARPAFVLGQRRQARVRCRRSVNRRRRSRRDL
jgi:hypothetical protein